MFGYVTPKECELKVREQAVYKSCYCGLCKSLKKHYGPVSSCFLTYDCTLLALLFGAVTGEEVTTAPCRCLHACGTGKRRYRNDSPALHFAAAVNVLLTEAKLRDDITDTGSFKARLARLVLLPAAKRAEREYPEVRRSTEAYLTAQQKADAGEVCADAAADPTGVFLKSLPGIFKDIPEKELPALEWLLYHLGRWIFFADAAHDREEDAKAGRSNVFSGPDSDPAFAMNASLNECRKALDLLTLSRDRGLLENIFSEGCGCKIREILTKGTETPHESL